MKATSGQLSARRRMPGDVNRFAAYLLVLLIGIASATVGEQTMAGIEDDLLKAVSGIPERVITGVVSVVVVLTGAMLLTAPIVLIATRRMRTLGLVAIAMAGTAPLLGLLHVVIPVRAISETIEEAASTSHGWPDAGTIAVCTAVIAILRPEFPRRVGRWLTMWLTLISLLGIVTARTFPVDVVLAVGFGGSVGVGLLLIAGRSVTVATPAGIVAALELTGHRVVSVIADETIAGQWSHSVELADGSALHARVVTEREWQVDRLHRVYRRIRLRDVGDDTPYSSPRRAAAVEALLTYHARAAGVRTPGVRALAPLHEGEVLLAVDAVTGTSLDTIDPALITAAVLDDCWQQIAGMRRALIAHRDLQLANVMMDEAGTVWISDLSFGQPAAGASVLDQDVAELLAALSVVVGPERVVASAVRQMGRVPVADAAPRLVPNALTRPTRIAIGRAPSSLDDLVAQVCSATQIEPPRFVDVERLKPRFLIMSALTAAAVYLLIPQLADLPAMLTTVRSADLVWLPWVVIASIATYVGAAMALVGGTPGRVPFGQANLVAVASSFVATVAPPGVGHIGLNVRFLQKRGFPVSVAVSATAAKEAAVVIVHLMLLTVFGIWVGRSDAITDEFAALPPLWVMGSIIVGVVVVGGLAMAFGKVRKAVANRVLPTVRAALVAMRDVVGRPSKLVTLMMGALFLPLGYVTCLYAAVESFGGGLGLAAVGVVYLTAGAVANAAPTPGGIGAVEVVLVAALTGLGLASSHALAAVFLFRLATFWLPIAPGLVSFRLLGRRGVL